MRSDRAARLARIGWLAGVFGALIEERRRQAAGEIVTQSHLLPVAFEAAASGVNDRNEDALPFAR